MRIVEGFSPMIETVSVDEAFVDVGGILRRYGTARNIAVEMKARIRRETGLTASVGVAPNKFLAKLGSDLNKPDGLTMVPETPAEIVAFLAPLPVTRIWGVGKVTADLLHRNCITTIGDVQARSVKELTAMAGPALAMHIHELAFGRDDRPVVTEYEAKSISSENTFLEDCSDRDVVRQMLIEQAEHVGRRLRRSGKFARVAQLKLRFDNFDTITRQQTFDAPTSSDRSFIACALALLEKQKVARPVRLIGFGVSDFVEEGRDNSPQPFLFAEMNPQRTTGRDARLDDAVDRLRDKFGDRALKRGTGLLAQEKPKEPKRAKGNAAAT
jgi:DNA polymerase-4